MRRALMLAVTLLAAAACKRSGVPHPATAAAGPSRSPNPPEAAPPAAAPAGAASAPDDRSMAAQHRAAAMGPSGVAVEKVARAPGAEGRTVEELWAQRGALRGKRVAVRGKVVKLTPAMGKNFLHLRDGSGKPGRDDDVTVTTADQAKVGEVVTARGRVATDEDVGAGYAYPVLLEDATISR